MMILRNRRGWVYEAPGTPAERTVLWFAGFSLKDGKKYRDEVDISAKHNREALNWLVRYGRMGRKLMARIWAW